MKIALDAMGGDFAPKNNVEGAVLALKASPEITKLFLVGDAVAIGKQLQRLGYQDERLEIYHASQIVQMGEPGPRAIRQKKDSSISRSVDLVKNGSADALVSAGHTGATVAACVLKLRTLPGIERPAVACLLPTAKGEFLLIDAGANPDSKPEHLLQFGLMGAAFCEHILGRTRPEVALMSIGEEDMKGNDVTKETFKLLKGSGLNFRGNVEGHDLYEHPVDVVVCDGFTGNVILKTSESIAYAIFGWLRRELNKGVLRKIGAKMAGGAFRSVYQKINAEEYGGMPLLGVNGTCIIAHGGSSAVAIKNAIGAATQAVRDNLTPRILREIQSYNEKFALAAAAGH